MPGPALPCPLAGPAGIALWKHTAECTPSWSPPQPQHRGGGRPEERAPHPHSAHSRLSQTQQGRSGCWAQVGSHGKLVKAFCGSSCFFQAVGVCVSSVSVLLPSKAAAPHHDVVQVWWITFSFGQGVHTFSKSIYAGPHF